MEIACFLWQANNLLSEEQRSNIHPKKGNWRDSTGFAKPTERRKTETTFCDFLWIRSEIHMCPSWEAVCASHRARVVQSLSLLEQVWLTALHPWLWGLLRPGAGTEQSWEKVFWEHGPAGASAVILSSKTEGFWFWFVSLKPAGSTEQRLYLSQNLGCLSGSKVYINCITDGCFPNADTATLEFFHVLILDCKTKLTCSFMYLYSVDAFSWS